MSFPFIKKVEKPKEKNHTPIDTKKLSKLKKESESHAVVVSKKQAPKTHIPFEFDRYILITILSFLFFLSGLGFWIYVNYLMS